MTLPGKRALVAPAISFFAGLGIGYVDSRPTWDDTGITAGAVFLAAAVLAAIAIGISLVGSGVGYVLGRVLRSGNVGRAGA